MCKRPIFSISLILLLGLVGGAWAAQAPFKVDLGLEGHAVPEGFFEISGGPGTSPEPWIVYDVGGTGIDVTLETTLGHALGFRDNGFHPLFGDGIFPDNYPDHGLIVTVSGLEPAEYAFTGYHNHIALLTTALVDVYVNEELVLEDVVQSGIGPGGDFSDVGASNFEFTVAQGQTSVEFKFLPAAAPPNDVWLNGFVIDYAEVPFAWWPSPSDGAENVDPNVVLGWTPGMDAAAHDVYFGTDADAVTNATDPCTLPGRGRQDANSYDPPGLLDLVTTYYWRIDEFDGVDIQTGEVWSFTVNDGRAYAPGPNDGIWGVPVDANLSWTAGGLATSHDVYFGTDFNDVNDAADPNTPPGRGRQAAASYDPGGLEPGATYYWRIDEHGPLGDFQGGLWSFCTVGSVLLHYKFDETGGSIAFDSSVRRLDGTVVGPSWDPDGYVGGCLGFDVGTGISCPLSLLEYIGKEITVAVWLYGTESPSPSGHGLDNRVFQGGGFGGGGSWEGFIAASIPREEGQTQDVHFRAGYTPNDSLSWKDVEPENWRGSWNHYAFVKDENEQMMRIYHNGEVVAEKDSNTIDSLAYFRGREFVIGRGVRPLSIDRFEGKMDDFRIYDCALSAARISRLYRVGADLGLAWAPRPVDGGTDVPAEVTLTWKPGDYPQDVNAHDVYFGMDFGAVSNAADPNTLPGRGRHDANEYAAPGPLELGGTYYWRIDEVNAVHPDSPWKGNVWSFTVDEGKAHSPQPGNGAAGVVLDANLSWAAGNYAASHDVYFGTDRQAVKNATDVNTPPGRGRQDANTCAPPSPLDLGTSYYWRIDEVNPGYGNSKGDLWTFTALRYLMVDNMESYDNDANLITGTWLDGIRYVPYPPYFEVVNGAQLSLGASYTDPPDPVYDGNQSMVYFYDNNNPDANKYSEIERTYDDPCDWTTAGVEALTLYFYGDPNNDANLTEQMYVGVRDSDGNYAEIRYGDNAEDMNDIKKQQWRQWNIRLQDFRDINSVELAGIKTVYIGFGDKSNPAAGGSGIVYFDTIRLYTPRCVAKFGQPEGDLNDDCVVDLKDLRITALDWLETDTVDVSPPDPNGLLVEYTFDTDYNDTSGNDYHGLPGPEASISDGKLVLNGALLYGAELSYVDIPLGEANPFDGSADYTIQMTFASTDCNQVLLTSAPLGATKRDYPMLFWASCPRENRPLGCHEVHIWYRGGAPSSGIVDVTDGMMHSVVATYNAATGVVRLYSDGLDDGSWLFPYATPDIDQHVVRIGGCAATAFKSDMAVSSFIGEIDSVRIYSYAVSEPEAMYLATDGTGIRPIPSPANLYNQEPPGQRAVNMKDFAVLADAWLEKLYWP